MKKPRITESERCLIEANLREGKSIYAIAKILSRPPRTIVREIKKRSVVSTKGAAYRIKNRCIHSAECTKRNICERCFQTRQTRTCRFCSRCNDMCAEFVEQICSKLSKPPYVCNGCKEEYKCVLRKKYYIASSAHDNYRKILVESRKGANISEEELFLLNKTLYHFTQNGLSVHAALNSHPDCFTVNEKTVYRYINGGIVTTPRGDLPRAPQLKARKKKSLEHKVDSKCRINRTYSDYKSFITENPGLSVVEMDTVEGVKGGKVLLTLLFMPSRFMIAFLLDSKTSKNVITKFDLLRQKIAAYSLRTGKHKLFSQLFPVILTDNGTEFSNPLRLENGNDGKCVTRIFYCEPNSAYQKAFIERNHEFIRKILPKGTTYHEPTSFDSLTQDQIDLMMSHINSYIRKGLDDESPFTKFAETYGEDFINEVFHIFQIPLEKIILKPSLLGIEQKVREQFLSK